MTKRSYYCNVCRDPIRVGDLGAFGKEGYGFRFTHDTSGWSQQDVSHAENHICAVCLDAAKLFAVNVKVQKQ